MATKKTKTTKKAKAEKASKPEKEKAPKEELCVFAFRLTEAERTAIHRTAGPAKASKFIRQVASAFANQDEAAFKAVLKEARELRG